MKYKDKCFNPLPILNSSIDKSRPQIDDFYEDANNKWKCLPQVILWSVPIAYWLIHIKLVKL